MYDGFMFMIDWLHWLSNMDLTGGVGLKAETSRWCWEIAHGLWVIVDYEINFIENPSDGSGK